MYKHNTDLYFPSAQLEKLVKDKYSAVKLVKNFESKLTILPFHLGFLKSAITELLQSKVGKYDLELDGVILGFRNVRIKGSSGQSDSQDVPLQYIADVYVFAPSIGETIMGVVNKRSREHVGVLVHGVFNASLTSPPSQRLHRHQAWPNVGENISFEIGSVDYTGRLLAIQGPLPNFDKVKLEEIETDGAEGAETEAEVAINVLDPEEISALFSNKEKQKKSKKVGDSSEAVGWDSGIASGTEPPDITPKKKRLSTEDVPVKEEPLSPSGSPVQERKKKRKKNKELKEVMKHTAEPDVEIPTESVKKEWQKNTDDLLITIKEEPKTFEKPKKKSKKADIGTIVNGLMSEAMNSFQPELEISNKYVKKEKRKNTDDLPISVKEEPKSPKKFKRKREEIVTFKNEPQFEAMNSVQPDVEISNKYVKKEKRKKTDDIAISIKEKPKSPEKLKRKRKREEIVTFKNEPPFEGNTPPDEPKKKRKRVEAEEIGVETLDKRKKKSKVDLEAMTDQLLLERTKSLKHR